MHCNRRHDKRNYVNTLHKKIALTYAINACLSCLLMFKESTYETKIQDGCAIIPTQMQTDGCIIRSGLVILNCTLGCLHISKLVKDGCDTLPTCKSDNQIIQNPDYLPSAQDCFATSRNLSNMRIIHIILILKI